jgi:hypothetical protein
MTNIAVARGLDDNKMVTVVGTLSDVQKAKDFMASPALKTVMQNAGVVGEPTVAFMDVVYDDTSHIAQQERLCVVHHVKDFDTWKKGFDQEGDSMRASYGVVERLMARNLDDPNTVTLFFAVTDMAKAKARVASPELKDLMAKAGVDSEPKISWFKWVR